MPKELIHDVNGPFTFEVRWGVDSSDIQVATVMRPQTSDGPQNLYDLVNSWDEGSRQLATGLYVTLDWHGCNRAIRSIRTARRKVYSEE